MLLVALAGEREHAPHLRLAAGFGENLGLLAGHVEAVSYISLELYMMPCVEYSGKITRSIPGKPSFMPTIMSAIFLAFSRTSALV